MPPTYTVRAGDTLGAIAREAGVTVADLLEANPAVKNPNRIAVGQVLAIPGEAPPPPDNAPEPAASFPLAAVPRTSYKAGMRAFGARRSGGARSHAGCDLYAPRGTDVYAVADGVVLRAAPFYLGTWAVEIDHGDFIARYGEVGPAVRVKAGDRVKRGQHIADVGQLQGAGLPNGGQMLHFELYLKDATGPLTVAGGLVVNGRPTARRRDLIDPTPFLDAWAKNLPAGGVR